ncbi:AI-2E family transporter [Corynebacterium sp. ES2794-CONJ1]|uniref:AI-2E family transporter n=1 Tax=unclassified Corynebacterium TaxID=2624378 RepID=UPI0021679000|nr:MULTISPECIES: AI-2E family transporter [unclassified Corynebacterium]MCS4490171.1 AI-2E family transporter [Corynebacterium sp. ES2775-CONJ]MCS4492017.1 AI-2E family transporter [Corynebacterium sp. ES2715-CONJ3]MCS4532122.1 AI-2E family transporter [Corynebacterium sp. ES2730-CONJ]MCU9519524.1 AI-2E family transporter [Corynebacterium sp. ES2794-CONJ1]
MSKNSHGNDHQKGDKSQAKEHLANKDHEALEEAVLGIVEYDETHPSENTTVAPSAVEDRDTHIVESDDPAEPIIAHTDRAEILGNDGRWVAGWALRFIIMVIAGYLAWRGLGAIWKALLPVLLAILVSSVLWPPVRWMRNKGIPAGLASAGVILGFFVLMGVLVRAMAPSVASQSRELSQRAAIGARQIQEWIQSRPFDLDFSRFDSVIDDLTAFLQTRSADIANGVFSGLSTATSILITIVLMLVLTFFFLKDGVGLLPMLRKAAGPNAGWHITEALTRVWNTISGFIRTQAIVSLVDAVFIGGGLLILGVPLALVLAVITFFAGFIPIVGAFSAGALAVIIALVSNGLTNALLVLLLILVVQQLEGNVLQPLLQSKAMNLHAAVVLLAVTLGSSLFGVIGAFLSVPVAATIAVLVRYHQELVALRAGEITIDDIELSTKVEATSPSGTRKGFRLFISDLAYRGRRDV